MKTTRLARRLGLDGNPLRRRTDKIAACLTALLLAVFLTGAPLLSAAAAGWAGRAAAAGQQAERSWRQVSAVLVHAAPAPASAGGVTGYSWVRARWTAPDGRERTGRIAVGASLAAGQPVTLWVDAAGSPVQPPLSHRVALVNEAAAAAAAIAALGIILLVLAGSGAVGAQPAPSRGLGSGMGRCRPPMDQALPVPGLAVTPRAWSCPLDSSSCRS